MTTPTALYTTGFGLWAYAAIAALFNSWQWFPIVAGLAFLVAGEFVELRSDVARDSELDEHFASVPREDLFDEIVARMSGLDEGLNQIGATWPPEAGAVE